ncbi:MAG TPA: phosphomannomutase/phosphoglucomutase [Candidatus Pacearchaeota archaeon]|jgi:phosphomannomutase|nr:phosphomannomutase/phosphoglucomutase [Candidatus Pacearchaeota archaeon]HQB18484.1 phosphomannomutase/phosphoglucomutase [Candidatus Pacearchaeota archaeon]
MIFKAYDIRGIYGEQLNEDIAYKIGRAFAMYIGSKIVVAKDNRLSSDSLFEALTRGITDQGSDVYNIGLSTSPMFYFAVSNLVCDGGVIITASHNPPQYNGFKMVRSDAMPLSGEDGIDQIKQLVEENNFSSSKKGNISTLDITDKYVNSFEIKKYNLRVVVDTANSVSGLIVNRMFSGVSLFHLFSELDGSFPNHEPNPLEEKNIKDLKEKVLEHGADIGIAFDGDGDRVFFVDEKGELISSDLIIALIAKLIDKKVLYDLRCSNIIKETARDSVMWRVGHSFIKKKMKDEDIFFGGEYSGHYYLKQGSSYFESPYFVIYKLFEAMENKKLSELIAPFKKYYHSGELNFEVKDKQSVIEKVEKNYSYGKITKIDGVRIDFDDWWFLLRGSNTEPILRLIVEAKSKELLDSKIKEIVPFFS